MTEVLFENKRYRLRKLTGTQYITTEEVVNTHWLGWKAAGEKYYGVNDPRVSIDYFIKEWIYCNSALEDEVPVQN